MQKKIGELMLFLWKGARKIWNLFENFEKIEVKYRKLQLKSEITCITPIYWNIKEDHL